jgi:hypothetical protein
MIEEALLEAVESGLAPVTPGWFIVNARDAAWVNNERTQGVCIFESSRTTSGTFAPGTRALPARHRSHLCRGRRRPVRHSRR